MVHFIKFRDVTSLSFIVFAFFVGAGNIIFPPMIGLQAGDRVWTAAFGFLITAVGLPVLTLISLAKVGGKVDALSSPIGKVLSLILSTICYLAVGPLFATPRTATVSFEVGVLPFSPSGSIPLFIYSMVYFSIVILVSLYPRKLLMTVGNFLAPLKILALIILAVTAVFWPAGVISKALDSYKDTPFSNGFMNGYLTMDMLGAMVFGIVIVNTVRSRGVTELRLLVRYIILAGLIAGLGLILLYFSLFRLGATSSRLVDNQGATGVAILHAYVHYAFGDAGEILLAGLIFLSCLVTAVGLTCACAEFFSYYLPLSYRVLVLILSIFSMFVSNLGLNHLVQISFPVLKAIYPPCIILVLMSFVYSRWWKNSTWIVGPPMFISLIFGILDGIQASPLPFVLPIWTQNLPLFEYGQAWVLPSIIALVMAIIWNQTFSTSRGKQQKR